MDQRLDLKNVNLYLISIAGIDQTSIGKQLAQDLQYKFMHTDTLIQQLTTTGQGQPPLTATERNTLESQVLAQVSAYTRLVVATGPGIVHTRANWSHLQQGIVVWLDLPIPDLWQQQNSQPDDKPLSLEALEQQMQASRHLYAQADVHLILKPDWSPIDTTEHLCSSLAKVIKTET